MGAMLQNVVPPTYLPNKMYHIPEDCVPPTIKTCISHKKGFPNTMFGLIHMWTFSIVSLKACCFGRWLWHSIWEKKNSYIYWTQRNVFLTCTSWQKQNKLPKHWAKGPTIIISFVTYRPHKSWDNVNSNSNSLMRTCSVLLLGCDWVVQTLTEKWEETIRTVRNIPHVLPAMIRTSLRSITIKETEKQVPFPTVQ
jgi:hypothetical protein